MKYLLIAVDNLNRDYKPDRIIALSDDEQFLKDRANTRNDLQRELFYKVVDRNYKLCFDSLYDIADVDKPSFKDFCSYTGVDKLSLNEAIVIYDKQFKLELTDSARKSLATNIAHALDVEVTNAYIDNIDRTKYKVFN